MSKSDYTIVQLALIIGPIPFLWNIFYTSVCGWSNSPRFIDFSISAPKSKRWGKWNICIFVCWQSNPPAIWSDRQYMIPASRLLLFLVLAVRASAAASTHSLDRPSPADLAAAADEFCPAWGPHSALFAARRPARDPQFNLAHGSPPPASLRISSVIDCEWTQFTSPSGSLISLISPAIKMEKCVYAPHSGVLKQMMPISCRLRRLCSTRF